MSDPTPSSSPQDVRMRGFSERSTVDEVLAWLRANYWKQLSSETVSLLDAWNRTLADDVLSAVSIPGFRRAMMDGYAVHAADTQGASSYEQLHLPVVGESYPGQHDAGSLSSKTAMRVMTGAPVPAEADAVLPVELTDPNAAHSAHEVCVIGEVAPQKNIAEIGEDIQAGTVALSAGRTLRPQDIGLLSSIGVSSVEVLRRPRVRIVVTGRELLPAGSMPDGTHIVDSNSPMLAALVQRDGGLVEEVILTGDEPDQIREALRSSADVTLISGGTSVGAEDFLPSLVQELGELPWHGIAMRPSSPTGVGHIEGHPVFLLPGNPVSCLCAYDFFARPTICSMQDRSTEWPYRQVTIPLRRKLVSTVGRVDYARVRIVRDEGFDSVTPLAISGASILSSTTSADGFVIVPHDREGFPAGANVQVYLYDA